MNIKFVILVFFLLLILPVFHAASSGQESISAALNAQCAKFPQDQCVFDENGNKRTVTIANLEINCEYNLKFSRCIANPLITQELENERNQKRVNEMFSFFLPFILIFLAPLLFFLKFSKSKNLKIIYGAKLVGIIIISMIFIFENNEAIISYVMIILFIILLEPILSAAAIWKVKNEQNNVKLVMKIFLALEIIVLLWQIFSSIALMSA